jgi:hypothetical protein
MVTVAPPTVIPVSGVTLAIGGVLKFEFRRTLMSSGWLL